MNKITIFLLSLFIVQTSVFADELSCKTGMQDLMALFTPKTISCNDNHFLPANSVVCSNCPNGYTCSGGDLIFNETKSSGIDYTQKITTSANNVCSQNFPKMLYANFRIAQRNCDPGYYLPANSVNCTICPANNSCPGGTYTFNETTDQGITPCSGTTPHAPSGSAVCYAHILHLSNERPEDVIYLKTTETTTPALHVAVNGVAYHANMTTTPTHMTAASQHYLKILYNDTEYYVCDDTTYSE